MQKIVFEDTTVVKSPYVLIDGVEHEVINGTYQGGTDLNAQTFNQMQDNIESAIEDVEDTIPTIENSLDSDSTTNGVSVHVVKEITTYSTTEKIIGKYIDNKPIYRKTISGTYTTDSARVVVDLQSNVSKLINSYGGYSPNTLIPVNVFGQPMIGTNGGVDAYSQARVSSSNVAQICFSSPQTAYQGLTGSYEVTIEYTKTTD